MDLPGLMLPLEFRAGCGRLLDSLEAITIITEVITIIAEVITTTLTVLTITVLVHRTDVTVITTAILLGIGKGLHLRPMTLVPLGAGMHILLPCLGWAHTLLHTLQKAVIQKMIATTSKTLKFLCTVSLKDFLLVSKRKGSKPRRLPTSLKNKNIARRNKLGEGRKCSVRV